MFACNQYITVWNKWRDLTDKQSVSAHYRHTLPVLCKYEKRVVRQATSDGVMIKNSHVVIIPVSDMYRPPQEWAVLDESEREKYFTLQEGDLVARGQIMFDITGAGEAIHKEKENEKV